MKKRLITIALAAALLLSLTWTVSAQPHYGPSFAFSAQSRLADKDIQLDTENTNARGAWSDGTTIWVTDYIDGKIYAYDLAANTRDTAKDFNGVASPRNIWSDGTTMWVTGITATVRAYKMSDRSRDSAKDFDASACKRFVGALKGIWSDGTTMWVVAAYPEMRIYAYKMSDKTCDASKTFDALESAGMTRPEGIWSDGVTMWAVEFSGAYKAFAFSLSGRTRDADRDIQLPSQHNIYDLWSDGATVWLVNYSGGVVTNYLYAYTLPPVPSPTPTPTYTASPTPTSTHTPTPRPNNNVGRPPIPPDNNVGGPPIPPDNNVGDPPLPPATPAPTRTPTPTPTPTPTATAASANHGAGAGDENGGSARLGIVSHSATPVQLFVVDSGLQCWFIGPNGGARTGPALSSVSALAAAHPGGASVSLYDGQHPLTNKPVRIDYLPALRKIRISTYYADLPPHQVDKPYIFTVDQNNSVNHLNW
ncbi:MAG: hypothetical protein OXI80_21240 [Caldilineaceae bacterium]|nr:hypothetical protein [Caldilineaceae bacterium]